MAKQVYKLDDFSGGLNEVSDARDLDENQAPVLNGFSVSNQGKLVPAGDMVNADIGYIGSSSNPSINGTNFGVFKSDNRGAQYPEWPFINEYTNEGVIVQDPVVASGEQSRKFADPVGDYYVYTTYEKNGRMRIWSDDTGEWNAWQNAALTPDIARVWPTSTEHQVKTSNISGNVRWIDSELRNIKRDLDAQTNGVIGTGYKAGWYGFVNRFRWGHTSYGTRAEEGPSGATLEGGMYTLHSQPKRTFSTFGSWYAEDMFCYAPEVYGKADKMSNGLRLQVNTNIDDWPARDPNVAAGDTRLDTYNVQGNMWVLSVSSNKTSDGGWRGRKMFYMTFIYDGVQESRPSPFIRQSGLLDDGQTADRSMRFRLYHRPKHVWKNFTGSNQLYPLNSRITGGRIYFQDVESETDTTISSKKNVGDLFLVFEFDLDKGIKKADSMEWIAWGDISRTDHNKGIFSPKWSAQGTSQQSMIQFDHEPVAPTYEALSGISNNEKSIHAVYKTHTFVNNKLYVGNVAILPEEKLPGNTTTTWDDTTTARYSDMTTDFADGKPLIRSEKDWEFHPDTMISSPPLKYDILPWSNRIDVTIGDGEEITCLENYADRILQFKQNKMHIINVSQNYEFLESTHEYKGVWGDPAVCKTDFGIAWVNINGCFLYDGQKVTNLLEKKGKRLLSNKAWKEEFILNDTIVDEFKAFEEYQSFIKTGMPSIGFLPKERKLIVLDSIKGLPGTTYFFDMVLGAWSKIEGGLETPNDHQIGTDLIVNSRIADYSSFINGKDGELMLRHFRTSDTKTIETWNEYEVCPQDETGHAKCQQGWDYNLETKDIDFGFPGVRKKIYKVYLSYKLYGNTSYNANADILSITYSVDGKPLMHNFRGVDDDGEPLSGEDQTPLRGTTVGNDGWSVAQLIPFTPSLVSNIYSFKLNIFSNTRIAGLEINDISIVYRVKNVK